eukprot:gene26370-32943_t
MNLRGKLSTDFPLRALPHDPLGGDNHCAQQARQVLAHKMYEVVFGVPPPDLFWPVIQPGNVSVWFEGEELISLEVDMAKMKESGELKRKVHEFLNAHSTRFGSLSADSIVLIHSNDTNVTLFISDVDAPCIYVTIAGYRVYALSVDMNAAVSQVKEDVESAFGISADEQALFMAGGIELQPDDAILSTFNGVVESHVTMCERKRDNRINIKVRTLHGEEIPICISSDQTIEDLKHFVYVHTGDQLDEQRLIFNVCYPAVIIVRVVVPVRLSSGLKYDERADAAVIYRTDQCRYDGVAMANETHCDPL